MTDSKDLPNVQDMSLGDKTSTSSAQTSSGSATPATDQPTGPIRTPFAHALPSCKPKPAATLTPEQEKKYEDFLATVEKWEKLPDTSTKSAAESPVTENERMFMTRECLLRYLRATNWSIIEAPKRLQSTMVWRREFDVESLTANLLSEENETGKQHILGFDKMARPCLYMSPGRQNTKKSERQIQHLVYMLERVVDMMEPGQEMTTLLINFRGSTNSGAPSVAQGRQTLNILQNHYPERLGRACVAELPWFISAFIKMITPFIDPTTREKMSFNEDFNKYVPSEQLDKTFGGKADFEYEHDKYWPALDQMCRERREAFKQRWVDGGKKLGEYEMYLRGGDQLPVYKVQAEKEAATAA